MAEVCWSESGDETLCGDRALPMVAAEWNSVCKRSVRTSLHRMMPRSHAAPGQFTGLVRPKARDSVRVPHGVHHALIVTIFRGGQYIARG